MTKTEQIQWFPAEKSGRNIPLNTDLDKLAIVRLPTMAEMTQLLREHSDLVIRNLWDARLFAYHEERQLIEAFVRTTAGALRWFVHAAVNKHLNTDQIRGIGRLVGELSMDAQRELLAKLRPSNRSEAEALMSAAGHYELLGVDLEKKLREFGSVEALLDYLFLCVTSPKDGDATPEQCTEVLMMLRVRGYILFPANFRQWPSSVKWRTASNPVFSGVLAGLMETIGHALTYRTNHGHVTTGQVTVLMSGMDSIDDISPELVDAIEALAVVYGARPAHGVAVGAAWRRLWNEAYPQSAFKKTRTIARKPADERRTSGDYQWFAKAHPALAAWSQPLADYVKQRDGRSVQAVITDLNLFCDYIAAHPSPPASPEATIRAVHIRDATFVNKHTLWDHLKNSEHQARRKNRILGYVRDFFEWYHDWSIAKGTVSANDAMLVPVSSQDTFNADENRGQTFRSALPSWLLRELHKILTEDDFAFAKKALRSDWVSLVDKETGKPGPVFWPGTSITLAGLLDLPVRTHQSRWLDSGEFDEFLFDRKTGARTKNPNPLAKKGRNEACLRRMEDSMRNESWVGLYINTNKTAIVKTGKRGYEIPFLPKHLELMLDQMRDWNARYLPPLLSTVTYIDDSRGSSIYSNEPGVLPEIAPLFRDPRSPERNVPASGQKVGGLWVKLLREAEVRIKKERGIDIELTTRNASGDLVWKYDLHTLRVSGISALIEAGVPLEVVSEFVAGHATLVMTLWYHRNSPGKLREIIATAHEGALAEGDFVGAKEFIENIEKFSPFLLSKNGELRDDGADVAFQALKEQTGLWSINNDGICPGTSCSTGGEPDEGSIHPKPVPGGRRCGLCRYWITGPAFILGQIAEANNLIFVIRKKGLQLKAARDEQIEHEDNGKQGLARQVRSRIEVLERDLQLDLAEWQTRYNYAMDSSGLLESYVAARDSVASGGNAVVPMITRSSAQEFKVTLQHSDEFVLLDHVTQMASFMTGYKNQEATLEKQTILSKVLVDNGMDPFLLKMNPERAEVASNMMSSLILTYVNAQDRARLFSGELKMNDIPALASPMQDFASKIALDALPSAQPGRKTIPIRLEAA